MAMLFTADLHLGHESILKSRTQFRDIEEHDNTIIEKWNESVKNNDEVYILGDLSFRSTHHISYYLSRMKGKKHLIIGNHDNWMRDINMEEYFVSVEYMKTIKYDHKKLIFCHYPMLEWPGSRYVETESSYLIHGHIHEIKNEVYEHIKRYLPHSLNAGVDINEFKPVTFEELKENNSRWYGRGQEDKGKVAQNMFDYFVDGMK